MKLVGAANIKEQTSKRKESYVLFKKVFPYKNVLEFEQCPEVFGTFAPVGKVKTLVVIIENLRQPTQLFRSPYTTFQNAVVVRGGTTHTQTSRVIPSTGHTAN